MFCFPNRVSEEFYDLYWENKTYKLKRSIALSWSLNWFEIEMMNI